jgi:hypothetical protein
MKTAVFELFQKVMRSSAATSLIVMVLRGLTLYIAQRYLNVESQAAGFNGCNAQKCDIYTFIRDMAYGKRIALHPYDRKLAYSARLTA